MGTTYAFHSSSSYGVNGTTAVPFSSLGTSTSSSSSDIQWNIGTAAAFVISSPLAGAVVLPRGLAKKLKLRIRCPLCQGVISWCVEHSAKMTRDCNFVAMLHLKKNRGEYRGPICSHQEPMVYRNNFDLAIVGCECLLDH